MAQLQRRLSFTPRLVPTLAAVGALALTLYLAIWQQGRAAEKRGLQAEFMKRRAAPALVINNTMRDGEALRYRQVIARGDWYLAGQIFLDNKTDGINGQAGYHVITPLRLAGNDTFVLVNRGWIARHASYPAPPLVATPSGDAEVRGLITLPTARFLELSNAAIAGRVWQNLTIDRYRTEMKLDVLPMVLLAAETTPNAIQGLQPITEKPDAGVEKHVEYMLTWYSLAFTVFALWIGLNFKLISANSPSAPTNK